MGEQPTGSSGPAPGTSSTTVATPADSTLGETSTAETSASTSTGEDTGEEPLPARLGVTADWQARTLSVFDLDALASGARTREEVVVRTIDLATYAPGPLEVELAPDGLTAVVSISPGFFSGFVGNLIGAGMVEQAGTLLVVELDTGVVTEIATMHVPMGLAITPDGTRVFTANYGLDDPQGSTMSVIDLPGRALIEEIEVGARPEQVSLSPDGTVGMLNVVSLGGVRTFAVDDPAGTLSDPLVVGSDPSDVVFIPGTSFVVVTNSLDPSNYVVVDVSDATMPVEVAVGPPPLGSFYAVSSIPDSSDVVLAATDFGSMYLFRVSVGVDGMPTEVWQRSVVGTSFPLGVAIDGDDGLALVAAPGINGLLVQDLETDAQRVIPWQEEIGPTYVALAP